MSNNRMWKFLEGPVDQVAPRLLGCELVRTIEGQTVRARIVEVEAYDQTDMASHTYRGMTARNAAMFGPAGRLYVYFTYGMHYCCNVVAGNEGHGAGVLIRAVEPLEGEAIMTANRQGRGGKQLANGPGKVCQALQIDLAFNGHDLASEPVRLIERPPLPPDQVIATPRIGIRHAVDVPWRFVIKP